MINIRQYINSKIKLAYDKHINISIDHRLIQVACVNNHNIDYCLKSLIILGKTLDKTHEELYNILRSELQEFDTSLDRNLLIINLKPDFIINHLNLNADLIMPNIRNRILVDFSSPNIAKDMHVGHLRSTIIGDSICKLFEMYGHEVLRINHIGDWGLQFGMIIEHLLEKYPNYEDANFSIADLQTFYSQSKKRFDTEPTFNANAYNKVVLLQAGDPVITKAWNFLKDISRQAYNQIYTALNVTLDECGESFYQSMVPSLVAELEAKGLITNENGWKHIKLEGHDVPLTVVKSDNGIGYDTTDLCAVRYRLVNLNCEKVIYVIDNGQAEHMTLIFKVAEMMEWRKPNQELIHVGFGVILGPDGKKFKSRSGDTVKLNELLEESLEKAEQMLEEQQLQRKNKIEFTKEEKDKIIKSIAYSSIKYADLAGIRTNDYKFSFDKMLSLKGNSGTYQIYEFVRICSILRKAGPYIDLIGQEPMTILEKEEINVCKQILLFPEMLEWIQEDLMFNKLCAYLYTLTNTFSIFHKNCRCLNYNENKELIGVNISRLTICLITKKILEKCFNILGIMAIDKM